MLVLKLSRPDMLNPMLMILTVYLVFSSPRSWAPDRTAAQAKKYIGETMGKKFAEGVILDMEAMWEESNLRVPMICFLSMGSDPTLSIEFLSKKRDLG